MKTIPQSDFRSIIGYLEKHRAVIRDGHLVGTSWKHLNGFVNMREVAGHAEFWHHIGGIMAKELRQYNLDVILGIETLGRTVAQTTAFHLGIPYIWCDTFDDPQHKGKKHAKFQEKLMFERFVQSGTRIGTLDDLLTSGSSVHGGNTLMRDMGAIPVVTGVAVRRNQTIDAQTCNSDSLVVLEEVTGLRDWTEADCKLHGPCSHNTPMILRPGHGFEWIENNPDYPVAR